MKLLLILLISTMLLSSCQTENNSETSRVQTIIAQSFEETTTECVPVNLEELKKIELNSETKEDLMLALR